MDVDGFKVEMMKTAGISRLFMVLIDDLSNVMVESIYNEAILLSFYLFLSFGSSRVRILTFVKGAFSDLFFEGTQNHRHLIY